MLIFFIIFLVILIGRSNSYLLGFELLNIDESQMMANAIRLQLNNYNIFQFDGTSSGFLNSLILTWPNLLNLDVTFLSTRITAIILISVIFYIAYLYLRLDLKKTSSILLVLPGVLVFSFTNDPDFLHYSSELLSTSLIIFALYSYKKYFHTNKIRIHLIGMSLLSLVIFAKTQIIPTALALFTSICIFSLYKKNYLLFIKSSVFFVLPVCLILSLYFFSGYFNDYYLNYFEFSKAVVSKYSAGVNIINNTTLTTNSVTENKLLNYALYNSVFHYFYFQIFISIIMFIFLSISKNYKNLLNINFILVVITILSIFSSIIVTGIIYRHYMIPLIPLTILFSGSLYAKIDSNFIKSILYKTPVYLISLAFLFSLMMEDKKFYSNKYQKTNFHFSNININSPNIFDFLEISKKKLYIWGWAPQWYVLSYFFPSDRSTISQKYIEDFSNKLYFNKRLNADLKSNSPNLIIDFVKPGSFYYTHEKFGIKNSSIKKIINNSFVKINKNEECPDIYIKKESYDKLNKKIIKFKIQNNLIKNKLDDYSITEDICNDSVSFDDKSPNKLILNLENNSKLKKILILASRKNESTVYMGVELEKKNSQTKILKKNIQLNKYPFWTEIKLKTNNLFIENILIDVSELKSLNYGINEIKLYR